MSLIATIDNGNTNTTVGLFKNSKLEKVISLEDFLSHYNQSDFIFICSSVGDSSKLSPLVSIHYVKDKFKDKEFFNMPVNYSETLGIDRLVISRKIFNQISETTLIIDAGTFITADFVSSNGFLGGYIFQGINTALKSYGKGVNLPSFDRSELSNKLELPTNTESAIKDAVSFQVISTIESLINKYQIQNTIFTGGCAKLIAKHFENASIYENLIHEALFDLRHEYV